MTLDELKNKTSEMEFCDYIEDQHKAIFHFRNNSKILHVSMDYKTFSDIEDKYASELKLDKVNDKYPGRPKKHIFDMEIVIDMYKAGATYKEIGEKIGIGKSYLALIIQSLVGKGFIKRRNRKLGEVSTNV